MNVLVIHTQYPHWGAYSGFNQFLRYINRSQYTVSIQSVPESDDALPLQNRFLQPCLRYLIQKRGMKWYKLVDLFAEVQVLRRWRQQKIEVIHYLDGEHSARFLPLLLNFFPKSRPALIATYHQPPELLNSLVSRNVLSKLDSITVVSPEQALYFGRFVSLDKVSTILHGIDVDHFKPGESLDRTNVFKCLTVGHYLRDFDLVREVATKLGDHDDIEFHVVSSQNCELERLPNIFLHRKIDDSTLLELYQKSNVLFLPLVESTANNAILEAIACGLPVLSTALTSVKTYVPGFEAILVNRNDPQAYVRAILDLKLNPSRREKMSQAARRRALQLDWRNMVPQYEALYSKICRRES